MSNKRTIDDLRQMQALPLEIKIKMSERRIIDWYDYWGGDVCVSFSGGKDSTALLHLVRSIYPNVKAVYVDTGLEYPEIKDFVKSFDNVDIIRPEKSFKQVVSEYGYPVVSKNVSRRVYYATRAINEGSQMQNADYMMLTGQLKDKQGHDSIYNCKKWQFLLDAPFECSPMCCNVMKKKPLNKYQKQNGFKPYVGMLAQESVMGTEKWKRTGCNAFEGTDPTSNPLSFWTKQDVLRYLKANNIPLASVYGDIVAVDDDGIEYLDTMDDTLKLKTTRADRTGCVFCMFGCHLEKSPNRFQRMKQTHPKLYNYCINGGEYIDGKLKPNQKGLGLGKILDYIGVEY